MKLVLSGSLAAAVFFSLSAVAPPAAQGADYVTIRTPLGPKVLYVFIDALNRAYLYNRADRPLQDWTVTRTPFGYRFRVRFGSRAGLCLAADRNSDVYARPCGLSTNLDNWTFYPGGRLPGSIFGIPKTGQLRPVRITFQGDPRPPDCLTNTTGQLQHGSRLVVRPCTGSPHQNFRPVVTNY